MREGSPGTGCSCGTSACAVLAVIPRAIPILLILLAQHASGQDVVIEQKEAQEIARTHGWVIREETRAGVIELAAIVNGMPWYNTTFNADAADSINADECYSGGSGGLGLTGSGVTLGLWDAGGVRLTHQEFGTRATQGDWQSVTHWHSTHVAGTMAAAGLSEAAKGLAPWASLDCYDWTYDVMEMRVAATAGLRASNHSYGFVQGWYYDSARAVHYWYGDRNVSNAEDYRFGLYGGYSYGLDLVGVDHPYYLICRSAGNDRSDAGPSGPEPVHLHWKTPYNVEWEDATDTHDPDGDYDSITTRNTAKNILTVGAVDDVTGGYSGPSSVIMSSFSGWGPCDDGRIKPDIVANGINLYSTFDGTDTEYGALSGTSMAAPSVAGSLGLLIEHWRATHPTVGDMRSATLKGLVLHTTDEAGSTNGPDYKFGWGLMNVLAAANTISADVAEPLTISEWTLYDGDWVELLITTANPGNGLRATICWTDPPGPGQSNVVDPPTKILVNDLDLRIERTSPLTTYQPWVLDGANPSAAATTGDNITDNVEQVVVYAPATDNFVVRVTHKGTLFGGQQEFSTVISGAASVTLRCGVGNVCTDDGIACTTYSCDPATGCVNVPVHAACDDGNVCTANTCDVMLGCINDGTGITVPCDDANECTTADVCQADAAGTCGGIDTSGVACDDSVFCTTGETCVGAVCGGGTTTDCSALANQCNTGVCNLTTDMCEAAPVTNGTACDDSVFCTENDVCTTGVCAGRVVPRISFNMETDSLSSAVTRDVTFLITTCGVGVELRVVGAAFDATGFGTAVLEDVDPNADWVSVQEGHTLSRLAAVVFDPCLAARWKSLLGVYHARWFWEIG